MVTSKTVTLIKAWLFYEHIYFEISFLKQPRFSDPLVFCVVPSKHWKDKGKGQGIFVLLFRWSRFPEFDVIPFDVIPFHVMPFHVMPFHVIPFDCTGSPRYSRSWYLETRKQGKIKKVITQFPSFFVCSGILWSEFLRNVTPANSKENLYLF